MEHLNGKSIRPTRFPGLGYREHCGIWRIYDTSDNRPAAIGPHYRAKAELLADLERYAREYGAV